MLPADRPEREVGWPRAVQTGIAILGACAFGAVALSYGYGFGGGGGRTETYPQTTVLSQQPAQPIVDVLQFATTGDSLRILGSAYSAGGDVHDSTHIQVDSSGGGFSSPKYVDLRIGAFETDTVTGNIAALDSGAIVITRMRYKATNGGWSEWSDSIRGGTALNEPSGLTVIYNNPGTSVIDTTDGWYAVVSDSAFVDRFTVDSSIVSPVGSASVLLGNYPLAATLNEETRGAFVLDAYSDLTGVTIGNTDTLYVRIRFNNNGNAPGGKFYYLGLSDEADPDANSSSDFYITEETNGAMGATEQSTGRGLDGFLLWPGTVNDPFPETGTAWESRWHTFEVLMGAESSVGAQDGFFRAWLDGAKLRKTSQNLDSLYWSQSGGSESSFNGLRLLFNVNQGACCKSFAHTISWAEIYVAGNAN